MEAVLTALRTLDLLVLAYVVLVDVVQSVLLVAAVVDLTAHRRATRYAVRQRLLGSRVVPRVSMLAPAYNEEGTVVASVRALLALRYPHLEVVVVNDGSRDGTLEALVEAFALEPVPHTYRRVLDSGRVRAVCARAPPAAARRRQGERRQGRRAERRAQPGLRRPGLRHRRRHAHRARRAACAWCGRSWSATTASPPAASSASSTARASSTAGCAEPGRRAASLPGVQVVEYLRAFLFGRLGWNRLRRQPDHLRRLRPVPARGP